MDVLLSKCRISMCVGAIGFTLAGCLAAQSGGAPYQKPALPIEQRVDDLVGRMTLEEKVSQMQNHAAAVPRLGIPEYNWWNEGLHGVARAGYATVFPQAIGMAATWDADLLQRVGDTISTEARAKYNHAIRKNIHSVNPSPADLEGTYLPAFRAAITQGHMDSLMCAYNAVDSVPACANHELLGEVLRGKWKFAGYVTSDCGAISDFFKPNGHNYSPDEAHAAAAGVLAGTDSSCGDEYGALISAVKTGLIKEEAIDIAVKRLFTARFRLGLFDPPANVKYAQIPFSENDSPAHRELALETARKSIVLLKNQDSTLPLGNQVKTIAVIGPNAASLAALEGNYNGVPSRPVLPIDGIEQEFGGRAKILYSQGAPYVNGVSLPVPRTAFRPPHRAPRNGLVGKYFANSGFRGSPVLTRIDPQIDFDWNSASPAQGIPAGDFSVRWTGTIAAPKVGKRTRHDEAP
jgi:beta-glucosidase-like glycosyl hydrolase